MFAFQFRKEIAIRIILIAAILFNTFVSAPVSAQEPEPTASPTPSVTETSTETPTPGVTVASTETPSPTLGATETPAETPTMEPTTSATPTPAATFQQIDFSRLPLSFVANVGQFDKKVKFQTNSLGGSIFFTASEVTLAIMDREVKSKHGEDNSITPKDNSKVVQIEYKKAEKNVVVDGLNLLPGVANFMAGSDKKAWFANAPTYDGIIYRNLYPGIDLIYEGAESSLKSTFNVSAGVDPSVINWKYKFAGAVSLDPEGNLIVTLPAQKADQTDTTLIEHTPIAWQEQDGQRLNVPVSYAVAQNGEVSFIFPQGYNPSLPLIIDPILTFSTYLGGIGTDVGNSITTDAAGNVYVVGYSFCTAFPITNPLQAGPAGFQDVIITKINASGNALRYSTCIGGAGDDTGLSISLDAQERIIVGGVTDSTNFPIVGGIATYGGTGGICGSSAPCQDTFILALNDGGTAIRYSTYLGGNGREELGDIALDSSGKILVVGSTSSSNFPTANAFDTTFATGGAGCSSSSPCYDVTITKINPESTGTSAIMYSTYLGGVKADKGLGMTLDASGSVYLTGFSESLDYPTYHAEQFERNDNKDIIISVIDTSISGIPSLTYSTYYGSHGQDFGYAIAQDDLGNVYLTGRTSSNEFHLRDPLQYISHAGSNCSGSTCYEAFVIKFNIASNSPIYSTFLGGSHNDEGFGIAVDSYGRAYVTGFTRSVNFPVYDPIQATKSADECASSPCADAFLSVLEPNGQSFAYSTYLGGGQDDFGNGIRVDSSNQVYLVGETFSTNFPTTPGVYDVSNTETNKRDVFITKIGALPTAPTTPTILHLDARILTGNDDAEQSSSGPVYLTNSEMELVRTSAVRTTGFRFAGLNIPQGATIVNAQLQFTADATATTATTLTIQAQASDNASAFVAVNNNLSASSRPRTTASVVWTVPNWTDEDSGPAQRSSNIAPVVQEVISRPGWTSGNALALIITGTGSRYADGYEDNVYDAAYLHIEYTIPTPTPTPTLTSTPTPTKALPPGLSCIDWRDGLPYSWMQSPWVVSEAQVVWDANGMHGSASVNGNYQVGAYFQMPTGGSYKLVLNGLHTSGSGLTVAQGATVPTSTTSFANVAVNQDGSYLITSPFVEVKWFITAPVDINTTALFQSFCYTAFTSTATPSVTPNGNTSPQIISTPVTNYHLPTGSGSAIVLDATIRDFRAHNPSDFEGGITGLVTGLVQDTLGPDNKPIFVGPNGRGAIASVETFNQWYNDVPNINQKVVLPLTLQETSPGSGVYYYYSVPGQFFPIDGMLFGNEGLWHNFHFTLELHTTFTYRGGETFNFTGDDDIWVFINRRLVVDLGGVHSSAAGSVNLDTLGLTLGQTYQFDFFFNERHTDGSNFRFETSIALDPDRQYAYPVQAVDLDDDPLTYSLVTAPTDMQIDSVTGVITWNPSTSDEGDHTISVQVSDGRGGLDVQTFTLHVLPSTTQTPTPTPTGPTPTPTITPTSTLTPTPTSPAPEYSPLVIPGWIGSPTQKSIVKGLVPITLANDVTLQSGTLDYWPVDDLEDIHEIATGLGGKTGGQLLGTLDTTTLSNGSYIVRLQATNSLGEQQDSGVMITVSGEYKPGRVRFTITDLTIPVAGLPITIARTYDSLERNEVGDFGYGWSLAIGNPKLEKDLAHNVTLTMPDGKRSTFYFSPQPYPQIFGYFMYPNYQPEAGVYGKLEAPDCLVVLSGGKYFCFLEDGEYSPVEYTYTDPYGRKFLMSADGTLKTITDLNNNVLTFTPNGITSSAGNINVPFVRDAQGRITQITYPAGKNYVYGYNASGELDTVTFPTVTQPTQQAIVLHYSYYSGHFFKDATDPRGKKPVFTTYDASNRIESVTDAAGNKTTYEYDLDLRKTTIHYLGDPANPADNLGDAVLIYDAAGYLTNYTDSLGNQTIYTYDGNHNLIKITNPLTHETKFTYNADGHPTSIIDPLGKTLASAQYNRYGSPTTLSTAQGGSSNITSTYDTSTFMLLTVSDSMGSLGKFTWWPEGTPKTFTNQFGETTNYTYTSEGYLETVTDPLEHVTHYSYNNFGQVTEVKTAFGTVDESIARYKYDELNRLIEVTKAFGTNDAATTRYEYRWNGKSRV